MSGGRKSGSSAAHKLLVTDLDGTLLRPGGGVHDRDRWAIGELLRRGIVVSIATGRMYSGTRDVALDLALKGPVACIDGSHIVDVATDAELVTRTISSEGRSVLRAVLAELELATVVFSRDVIYHDERTTEYLPYLLTWSDRVAPLDNVLHEPWWLVEADPAATVSIGLKRTVRRAEHLLRESAAHALQVATFAITRDAYSNLWGMIVRASGASKGSALEWMAHYHGCSLAETIAVGDWVNDIPMLRLAGRSFCMAQAPAEVCEAADEQLESDAWSGGAIAEIAERCGLL